MKNNKFDIDKKGNIRYIGQDFLLVYDKGEDTVGVDGDISLDDLKFLVRYIQESVDGQ